MNHIDLLQYIESFIKFFSLSLSINMIYNKINNKSTNKSHTLYILSILTSIFIMILINHNVTNCNLIFTLLTIGYYVFLYKKTIIINLFSIMTSIGCTYCIYYTTTLGIGIISWFLNYHETNIIIITVISLFLLINTYFLLKTRRIRNGISYLLKKSNWGIGFFILGIIIIIVNLGENSDFSKNIFTIFIVGIVLSGIGLFLWIRKSITEHYRKKLQAKADEHYQNTLAEKDEHIEQLSNSNAYLSKVVHRDNHLMSALQYSIEQYKNCDDETEKQKILDEIFTLTNERKDLLLKEQQTNKILQTTGSAVIDGALGNMYVKATAHNIDFNLVVNDEVHYLINNIITQTDLETLLCDHIKDAIIAIDSDYSISGKILVTIGMVENIYEISIKDNGVDFDINTLSKLGIERVTTHKENGGSGIGFMTTFETLNKTGTSLIITEYETKVPFSKSITFRFDGLNSFVIKSYRSDELKKIINRDDVIIRNHQSSHLVD